MCISIKKRFLLLFFWNKAVMGVIYTSYVSSRSCIHNLSSSYTHLSKVARNKYKTVFQVENQTSDPLACLRTKYQCVLASSSYRCKKKLEVKLVFLLYRTFLVNLRSNDKKQEQQILIKNFYQI